MSGYSHLTRKERDQFANLRSEGLGCNAIARRLGRSASTISRELRRNACESGSYRPHLADGAYMLRRQRPSILETEAKLAAYVTDRLSEGWSPEQIAGRLRRGLERGLRGLCTEAIYAWIYRNGAESRKALAVSHAPPCPAPPTPRPGLSRQDRRQDPYSSAN
jgi:transposase, IS30 family